MPARSGIGRGRANLGNLADALIDAGRYAEAIQRAGESVNIGEEIGSPVIGSDCSRLLALAHLCAGDLPAARAAAEAARRYDVPQNNHNALALLGVIALRQDDRPAAREAFAAAVAAADGILAQTPEFFGALDAKGLACCGLALCDGTGAGFAPSADGMSPPRHHPNPPLRTWTRRSPHIARRGRSTGTRGSSVACCGCSMRWRPAIRKARRSSRRRALRRPASRMKIDQNTGDTHALPPTKRHPQPA